MVHAPHAEPITEAKPSPVWTHDGITGTTLDKVQIASNLRAAECSDQLLPAREIVFDNEAQAVTLGGSTLTDNALRQALARAAMPPKAFHYIVTKYGAAEAVKNLNEDWKAKRDPESMTFVRSHGKSVRAFLSNKYTKMDNAVLIGVMAEAFAAFDKVNMTPTVFRHHEGDDWLHLSMVFEHVQDVDGHGIGIHVKNSETGCSSVRIEPFLFREMCLNGLIVGYQVVECLRQQHTGSYDVKELAAQLRAATDLALDTGRTFLKQLNFTREFDVNDADALIYTLAKRTGLDKETASAWKAAHDGSESDGSVFGVIQGLTRAAKGFEAERQTELETIAGGMVAPSITAQLEDIEKLWGSRLDEAATQDEKKVKAYLSEQAPILN